MEDPRIAVLMEQIDARHLGQPTPTAQVAMRVSSILQFVEGLRAQLMSHNVELAVLEERFVNLNERMNELNEHYNLLSELASTAAVRLMKTTNRSLRAQFLKDAERKQKNLDEFETDFQEHRERYTDIKHAFANKHEVIKEFINEIAMRMNTVDELLKSADISWPLYHFDQEA